jgi:hypothetical protein
MRSNPKTPRGQAAKLRIVLGAMCPKYAKYEETVLLYHNPAAFAARYGVRSYGVR